MAKNSTTKSVFQTLFPIDVNEHVELKGNLKYLSWAWAWIKVKENYPDAFYTIYENKDGLNYHTDGRFCWVKTGVTIEGLEHIEYLPVMDMRNNSIPLGRVTSTDVNKAIQRSLTKAAARHGLGLYIYAGEDLPGTPDDQDDKGSSELEEAFAIIRPNVENAPSRQYLKDLCEKNPGLTDYAPFKEAVNKRWKEVA